MADHVTENRRMPDHIIASPYYSLHCPEKIAYSTVPA